MLYYTTNNSYLMQKIAFKLGYDWSKDNKKQIRHLETYAPYLSIEIYSGRKKLYYTSSSFNKELHKYIPPKQFILKLIKFRDL